MMQHSLQPLVVLSPSEKTVLAVMFKYLVVKSKAHFLKLHFQGPDVLYLLQNDYNTLLA